MLDEKPVKPEILCPVKETLKILGKRWTILIIKDIYYSPQKKLGFMELRKLLVEVSPKVLSERLKEMAEHNLISKKVIAETTPVRVEYALTDKGADAVTIINNMKKYGLKWAKDGEFDCEKKDCEICTQERLKK
ncbi:MAG TPA: transcriptional regulator [Candidatus Altiarchaeales archaeon]|nr:transcriptional regulator [Candidatus Altiarchaeales archaeon]